MTDKAPIIIIGAGISGLALAQGLNGRQIPFHIYERDPSLNYRSQGYRVRLNGLGIDALRSLLTPEMYEYLDEHMAINTNQGPGPPVVLDALTSQTAHVEPPASYRPVPITDTRYLTADRSVLRMVLTKGLEEHITYSKAFSSYVKTPLEVRVSFEDGTSSTGSVIVGADGSNSKVRTQLLPDHRNIDTEARWFFGKTVITPSLLLDLHLQIAAQNTLVQDKTKAVPISLILEPIRFKDSQYRPRLPEDYVYWVLGSRKDVFGISDADQPPTHEAAANLVLELTQNWDPSIQALFKHQDRSQTSFLKIDSAKPDIPVWATDEKITLIGDAAHAMSPTAGVGAVTALRSAAALFKSIEKDGVNKHTLRRYEDEMRSFAIPALKASYFWGKILYGMRSFEELVEEQESRK